MNRVARYENEKLAKISAEIGHFKTWKWIQIGQQYVAFLPSI